ncbi:MAG: MIP family channel protein [Leptospiraceae bacterium]|nr:MIP family channel protein [Leptospiraceae bacterium]MCK6381433.1 MIP family channel protein [Leptospiraceae bacterium]NUM41252.1 MIP family channel protein [Leptospiraceae bacterium]
MDKQLQKELLSEFFGTFILILFGDGVVAMVVLYGLGSFESINWCWGLAVVFGIYVSSKTSGAHLNPAVSVALAIRKILPWKKVIPYSLSQIFGAFVASALLYYNYNEAFFHFEKNSGLVRGSIESIATAKVFATYPSKYVTNWGAFFDQILGTALLIILIFAVTNPNNEKDEANRSPFIIGLVVVAIGMAFGGNAGYAINPARDFGPRLFSYFSGWGKIVFTASDYYFYVPIVAPIIGSVIGTYAYIFFVGRFLDKS